MTSYIEATRAPGSMTQARPQRPSALVVLWTILKPLFRGELNAVRLALDVLGFGGLVAAGYLLPGWIGLVVGTALAGIALLVLSARLSP